MAHATVRALVIAGALASVACQPIESPATPLAEGEVNIAGIAVDEFSLYFIKSEGTLKSVSLDGGHAAPLTTDKITDPRHIAVDDKFVYFGTSGGTVARVPKASGNVETLIDGLPAIKGLAVDPTHVYFAAGDEVRKMSLTDQEQTSLAASPIVDGTLKYSGGSLYWVGGSTGSVQTLNAGETTVVEPTTVQTGARAMGVDGSFIYWGATDPEDPQSPIDTLHRKRHDGTDECVVATDQGHIFQIVGDEDNVYWTNLHEGTVSTAPSDCSGTAFAFSFVPDGEDEAVFLAQDAAYVYYARSKTGTIWTRPKGSLAVP